MSALLVTISFSHFCEKARWALDRAQVPYTEEAHAPIMHLWGTKRRGGSSTPLLRLADGTLLRESTDIVHHAESHRPGSLRPPEHAAEIDALVKRFDDDLGPAVRRIVYYTLFESGEPMSTLIRDSTTGLTRAAAPILGLLLPPLIKRGLKIDEKGVARSRAKLEPLLNDVEAMLADGRRFLVGDRFTAADLTFAALYSPVLVPPEQPVTSRTELPPCLVRLRDEALSRPAGQFAARIYRDERAAR
jgi:glutathione S-transferase